jgi:hypothetical protein
MTSEDPPFVDSKCVCKYFPLFSCIMHTLFIRVNKPLLLHGRPTSGRLASRTAFFSLPLSQKPPPVFSFVISWTSLFLTRKKKGCQKNVDA